eukprot:g1174.t1
MLCLVGAICALIVAPAFQFYNTMDNHPDRCMLPHFLWTFAQTCGTVGCFVIFGLIGQVYSLLLESGQSLLASLFLPFAGFASFFVSCRKVNGQGPLAGDQLYVAAPCLIFSAHAFAEATRSSFRLEFGALQVALNISARLGWSRFILIQFTKMLKGGPTAMAIFAPTGWSKFHDELKIYCGYYRFVLVLALVAVRAMMYQSFQAEVVTRNDPWKMSELEASGKRSMMTSSLRRTSSSLSHRSRDSDTATSRRDGADGNMGLQHEPEKTVSLGIRESYLWARLRSWFGQSRALNSSPALHGLRELPFMVHLSFIGIVGEFTSSLLGLLIGAGYMRGLCPEPLQGPERVVGLLWWQTPLPC